MKGKNRCKILKDIRKRIALENDIEYITTECKYKGDCLGTCPKCESEVRYLESELEKRRNAGYKVTVAGLAVGLTIASAGCDMPKEETLTGDMSVVSSESNDSSFAEMGELVLPESSETLMGVPPADSAITGETIESMPEISNPYIDIMGDYAVFDYDLSEVVKLTDEEIYNQLRHWNREFIDFAWKDNICRDLDHTELTTVFMTDNGETLTVEYNEAGEVVFINGKYMADKDDEK